ncbi:MAG: hypothetical protein HDR05_02780 [Lachnospiraceae bacterium]|nr:hypothetical protein [Lachnospiraceae bacterium]
MTNEIKTSIQSVYEKLWEVLALYEKTDCYNTVPPGEKEQDISEYMGNKLLEIKREIHDSFLEYPPIRAQLMRIVKETAHFVGSYEVPGVVTRWKRHNPQLLFFDCAFDLMEKYPDIYLEMRRGLRDIHLSCYPDSELIAARKAYFERIRENDRLHNREYSEDRAFQEELLNTLKLLFEDAFKKYL